MNPWGWTVMMMSAAFVIGGVPFGWVIGKAHGIDIRHSGSGNIGATNVGRVLGRKWGLLAFLLDMLKGLVPTIVVGRLVHVLMFDRPDLVMLAWLMVGIATIFGHNFSPFLGFKGGKGVATSLGVTLGVYPGLTLPGLVCFGIWILVVMVTRYVSLGSILSGVAFPVLVIFWPGEGGSSAWGDRWPTIGFALLLGLLVLVRHRSNLTRLLTGREPRIGHRSKDVPTGADRRAGDELRS